MHCASCGYPFRFHDLGTNRCPIESADINGRRGTWRVPRPADPALYPEIMRRDAMARRAEDEEAKRPYEPPPPPQIAARAPQGPTEYATSNRGMSAVKLGRLAMDAGWEVEPWYWKEHDGTEGCALRLAQGALRAVAVWSRTLANAGGATGWKAEYAYAWRADVARFPARLNITDLENLLNDQTHD